MIPVHKILLVLHLLLLGVRTNDDDLNQIAGYGPAPNAYIPDYFPPVGPAPQVVKTQFSNVFNFPTTDVSKGGCTPYQQQALETAFKEAITMASSLYVYLTNEIEGRTNYNQVGDMLWEIFGIAPSNYIINGGPYDDETYAGGRSPEDREKDQQLSLQYMRGLMVLIGWHGSGELIWRLNPAYRTTRLYCDSSWWQTEEYQRDDEGKVTQIKFANGPRYVDPVGFVTRAIPSGGMFDPTLGLCGPDAEDHDLSDAITNRGLNVITFCPSVWKAGHPVTIPQQLADPTRIPPFPIGDLDSLTWTFFHEYTHLVGASIFFPEGVIDVKNNRGGMCYGFPECSFLGGSRLATINADNYVLLALASYLYMYDWSDGTCRIP